MIYLIRNKKSKNNIEEEYFRDAYNNIFYTEYKEFADLMLFALGNSNYYIEEFEFAINFIYIDNELRLGKIEDVITYKSSTVIDKTINHNLKIGDIVYVSLKGIRRCKIIEINEVVDELWNYSLNKYEWVKRTQFELEDLSIDVKNEVYTFYDDKCFAFTPEELVITSRE